MKSNTVRESLRKRLAEQDPAGKVAVLFEFLADRGQTKYDESVTQIEHALQCAALAARDGCDDAAITAALLHDIGHLFVEDPDQIDFLAEDLNHEDSGADLLAEFFPRAVSEPVRLHVAAKRYLCTTDADYYERLSPASQRSFAVQGGKLSPAEQRELEANPNLEIALKLRRFDDAGKVHDLRTHPLTAYTDVVRRSLRASE